MAFGDGVEMTSRRICYGVRCQCRNCCDRYALHSEGKAVKNVPIIYTAYMKHVTGMQYYSLELRPHYRA